jgi:hypothetical protein
MQRVFDHDTKCTFISYVNYIISFGPPLAEATSSHSDKNRSSRKGEAPKTSTMLNQSQYLLDSTLITTRVTSL